MEDGTEIALSPQIPHTILIPLHKQFAIIVLKQISILNSWPMAILQICLLLIFIAVSKFNLAKF